MTINGLMKKHHSVRKSLKMSHILQLSLFIEFCELNRYLKNVDLGAKMRQFLVIFKHCEFGKVLPFLKTPCGGVDGL